MSNTVLLYPKRGGAGGANKAEPFAFPAHLAQKMLKNGWSNVPDVSDPTVAESLIEKAQTEVLQEKAKMAKERAEILAMKEEIEALKQQLTAPKGKKAEV
jgi:hypothetical protein